MTENNSRRVVANIALSLDGRVNGQGGDYDMSWIVPHAVTEAARDHMTKVTSPATTALLGRKNYEGFGGYWPTVADNEDAAPQDRAFSKWLNETEKVVFSNTLTEAPWQHSRIATDPAGEVAKLREQDGGDIIVLASSSVIRTLLEADQVDRLSITLCPELVGGGARLFEDGVPATHWSLTDLSTSDSGAICLLYDRVRD